MAQPVGGLRVVESHHGAFGQHRYDALHAKLRGLLHHHVHAFTARDALRQCHMQRRLPIHIQVFAYRHPYGIARECLHGGRVLTARIVEQDQRLPGTQAQDARDMIGSRAVEFQLHAAADGHFGVDPVHAHVASSSPSRATSTMSSMCSGSMMYGGMK